MPQEPDDFMEFMIHSGRGHDTKFRMRDRVREEIVKAYGKKPDRVQITEFFNAIGQVPGGCPKDVIGEEPCTLTEGVIVYSVEPDPDASKMSREADAMTVYLCTVHEHDRGATVVRMHVEVAKELVNGLVNAISRVESFQE